MWRTDAYAIFLNRWRFRFVCCCKCKIFVLNIIHLSKYDGKFLPLRTLVYALELEHLSTQMFVQFLQQRPPRFAWKKLSLLNFRTLSLLPSNVVSHGGAETRNEKPPFGFYTDPSMLDTTQHKWTPAASVEIMILAVLCRTKSSADHT